MIKSHLKKTHSFVAEVYNPKTAIASSYNTTKNNLETPEENPINKPGVQQNNTHNIIEPGKQPLIAIHTSSGHYMKGDYELTPHRKHCCCWCIVPRMTRRITHKSQQQLVEASSKLLRISIKELSPQNELTIGRGLITSS